MSLHHDSGEEFVHETEAFEHTVASNVRFKSHMYAYCSVVTAECGEHVYKDSV